MQIIRPADHKVMPWKNGGGSTTEIAIHPVDAGVRGGDFLWRLSIADVAGSGPFSRFPGYDRHIMVIEGHGMTLDAGDDGQFVLDRAYRPVRFSGDLAIEGVLHNGPVRDFNLMVKRAFASSMLDVVEIAERTVVGAGASILLVHILSGEVMANGHVAVTGETLHFEFPESVAVSALGDPARAAVCSIMPRVNA